MTNKVAYKNGKIQSIEAADASWWIVLKGSHDPIFFIDDEDARSVVGPVGVDNTPYPPRYVGHGAIDTLGLDYVGVDEGDDHPIISDSDVARLAGDASK